MSLPEILLRLVLAFGIVVTFVALNALFLVWLERKVSAVIQNRMGPMEVGPIGLLQTMADALKLLGKEMITPTSVDRIAFLLAPIIAFLPAPLLVAAIPIAEGVGASDLNVGAIYLFAIANIAFLGILMAGWSSNNKYSLLGAMRAVAQNVSYEIPMLLAVLTVILMAGSLKLSDVVAAQSPVPFIVFQPIAFVIYLICGVAESNRTPFDLPEAESELVAGYHTEFTGMRFALFFLAEYTQVFVLSAIITLFFLGGWNGPFLPGWLWFFLKTYVMIFIVMWLRWTYPRLRSDQLMNFNWRVLLPLAILNLLISTVLYRGGL
ncbi:MAG: NADH-quinone oxidoreductase subunit NuoH [Calditrichaeota bacterium]|nr:NADH-quinone oxidoreductase subunit NuoH [Calditrichota bacterium]